MIRWLEKNPWGAGSIFFFFGVGCCYSPIRYWLLAPSPPPSSCVGPDKNPFSCYGFARRWKFPPHISENFDEIKDTKDEIDAHESGGPPKSALWHRCKHGLGQVIILLVKRRFRPPMGIIDGDLDGWSKWDHWWRIRDLVVGVDHEGYHGGYYGGCHGVTIQTPPLCLVLKNLAAKDFKI
jgi:hypothetical protein